MGPVEIPELITDSTIWDAALLTLPAPHILQSWTWGELKGRQGWKAVPCLWRGPDGTPAAAAMMLLQSRGRLCLGYIPKGPIMDWNNYPLVDGVLTSLEQYARRNGIFLLKIDPDVEVDTPAGEHVLGVLHRRGWMPAFEQIQFRNTMFLDLSSDLDALMAQMKPKGRYNVRLAVRKGVVVREAEAKDFPLLYQMYAETAQRDGFIIRDAGYYQDVWSTFQQAGQALPLIAEVNEDAVAMVFLLHFGKRAWYMYGASRDLYREWMPNYLLQWEAIRRARELGCTVYDLWGAPDMVDESDPMWGVYRFKSSLGAEISFHMGAYDFAPHPWLYRIYRFLRPRLVALAQRRYWERNRQS